MYPQGGSTICGGNTGQQALYQAPKSQVDQEKKEITEIQIQVVVEAFTKYKLGAVCLEKIIDSHFLMHIPHNTIHHILKQMGLAMEQSKKHARRKWIRYERIYSNSLWHADYKQLPADGRWLIAYEDDASRYITGYGVFSDATSVSAVSVLKEAISKYGKPASILTEAHSSMPMKRKQEKKGLTEFEQYLIANDIRHIVARTAHPQTNGKLERIYGEIEQKMHLFSDIRELVHWYNNIRPHMSLDWDNLETPAQAYIRKIPPEGVVMDMQSGEVYDVRREVK
jgi:putative transposase